MLLVSRIGHGLEFDLPRILFFGMNLRIMTLGCEQLGPEPNQGL
jgi:hypothetical protein